MGSTSRRVAPTELIFIMSRGGTSSPRLTVSSAMTPGIGGRLPATACGAGLRRLSRRSLHRQGARERPSGRYYHCAGGVRDGEGKAPTPGQAHELAIKGAETDATKRALATFGNPFGLALYDREQAGVRKTRGASDSQQKLRRLALWCCAQAPASLSQATTLQSPSSKL